MFSFESKYTTTMKECPVHGFTEFVGSKTKATRCKRCRNERRNIARKNKQKEALKTQPLRAIKTCATHGDVTHTLEGGSYYCAECKVMRSTVRRERIKKLGVELLGGSCVVCGYDKYIGALEFHHVNPDEKEGSKNRNIAGVPIKRLKEELKKCVLVCANCHREIHGGYHPHLIIPV